MTAASTDHQVMLNDPHAAETASPATAPKITPGDNHPTITPFIMGPPEVPPPKKDSPEISPPKMDNPEISLPKMDSPEASLPKKDSPETTPLTTDSPETAPIETTSPKTASMAIATLETTPTETTPPGTVASETILTKTAPTEASLVEEFFTLPDDKFPKRFHLAFDDYLYQPGGNLDHAKVTQVLEGMLRLRWIYNDEYHVLVKDQPASSRLQPESFKWMHELLVEYCRTPEYKKLLIILILIKAGEDISSSNHEEIYLKFTGSDCTPSIANLDHPSHAVLKRWLSLASQLKPTRARTCRGASCLSRHLDRS